MHCTFTVPPVTVIDLVDDGLGGGVVGAVVVVVVAWVGPSFVGCAAESVAKVGVDDRPSAWEASGAAGTGNGRSAVGPTTALSAANGIVVASIVKGSIMVARVLSLARTMAP